MRTLDLTADLSLTEGTYRVIERTGSQLRLKNMATGERSIRHIADVTASLTELPPLSSISPRVLESLTVAEQDEIDFWTTHIEEMTTGHHPRLSTPRPEYDPAKTTQNERAASKSAELHLIGVPCSRATLMRRKKALAEGGPAALIDGRKLRQVGPLDRVVEPVLDAMTAVIARQNNKSTVTRAHLFALMSQELLVKHGDVEKLPSKSTMYRHHKMLTKGLSTNGRATTRRSVAGTPDRTYGTKRLILPGQEVLLDSHTMDLEVITAQGPQRPIVTFMIDHATRSIIACTLRLKATKGYDHALLLAQALVPSQNRPDRSEHRALIAYRHPELTFLSGEERRRLENIRPFIFPRRVVTDNGRDYLSDVFLSACAKYGIDITQSAIHTPTDKAIVERTFRSLTTSFVQGLPGYIGSSPVDRGRAPSKNRPLPKEDQLLDLASLAELLDDWILDQWNNQPHNGLRDPFEPSETFSPNQWFNATVDLTGSIALPFTSDDFIDLLPTTWRTISPTGVQFKNRQYDSVALHPHRLMPSNIPTRNNQWEIKYNPYDVTHVWVRSPHNEWLECRWRLADSLNQPHFGDVHQNLHHPERDEAAHRDAYLTGTAMPAGSELPPEPQWDSFGWDAIEATDLDNSDTDESESTY